MESMTTPAEATTDDYADAPVWRVDVTVTEKATIYVQAPTKAEAIEAAGSLVDARDFEAEDEDYEAHDGTGEQMVAYWTGGASGRWVEP